MFDKWVPELTSVTGPATYKATYTSTSRVYQVTLNVNDGTIGENVTDYTYGTAVTLSLIHIDMVDLIALNLINL